MLATGAQAGFGQGGQVVWLFDAAKDRPLAWGQPEQGQESGGQESVREPAKAGETANEAEADIGARRSNSNRSEAAGVMMKTGNWVS